MDVVFFAVGWPPNTEQLGLEAAGIQGQRQGIPVDAYLRTEVDHIYAPGDVNGRSMLVPVARLEGRVAAQNASGARAASSLTTWCRVPASPTQGTAGSASPSRLRPATTTSSWGLLTMTTFCARSRTATRRDSANSLPTETTGGSSAHTCLGEYSAEIIQVVVACMASGMTVEQVAELPFAFPTFTEGITMAAQKICTELRIGNFLPVWSYLGPDD